MNLAAGDLTLSTADRPYRMFVEHMRDGAATMSAGGLVMYANPRLAEMLSCSRAEIVGSPLARFLATDAPITADALLGPSGLGATLELDLIDGGGRVIPVLVGSSLLEVDGDPLTCLTFTDLSAQKAQDREIARLSEAQIADGLRFAAVVEALQEGVLVQDEQGRVLAANRMASEILGVPAATIVTDPPSPLRWSALHANGSAMHRTQTPGRVALDRDEPVLGAVVGLDSQGERHWLEIDAVPLRFPGMAGAPVVISSFRDVTARLAADEEIRFQALLLDAAGQAIVATDPRGVVLFWNKQAERMYGWPADEALGQLADELLGTTQSTAQHEEIMAKVLAGESWTGDYLAKRRDGTELPILVTDTPIVDADGNLVAMIGVAMDITERKQAEDQSRRLSAMVESSSDAIVCMTLDRLIVSWNVGAERLFGYRADEVIGRPVSLLAPSLEDDQKVMRLARSQGLSVSNLETPCLTKDGAVIQVALSLSPILDERGHPTGVSCIGRDITERLELEQIAEANRHALLAARRTAELEAMERDEANRSNRAKSEFLSRMSHELRTPLNAVLGFGQLLGMDDLSEDQRENVESIDSAGKHLLGLINDVLDISGIEAGRLHLSLEPVRVDEVLSTALDLIRPQAAQQHITIPAGIDGHGQYVQADRQRLVQIMLNLLSNAVKYNRPGGHIDLVCESSGGTVSISVVDTGYGIGERDLAKLFTPFERLGAESTSIEGTGVGLALSRSLSQQMGGALTVSSTLGTGSVFTLELPAGELSAPTDTGDDAIVVRGVGGTSPAMTVLAIEDNVANVRLIERAMARLDNVDLLTAIQGRLGLDLASQHLPDLILLDLHLPDLPGEEVLRCLQADPATSSIPVVICSADASLHQAEQLLDQGAVAYLAKPIDLVELFELIDRVRAGDAVATLVGD